MMNQQSYYSKYLKYKKKYLDLKKLIGGDDNEEPSGPTASEILDNNLSIKLYIKGFEEKTNKIFCEVIKSEDVDEHKLIIDFNNKDISHGPDIIFDEYRQSNEKNYSKTFGELYNENKKEIDEYCQKYDKENRPDNVDDGSLVTGLDVKNTNDDIEQSILEERKDNNVTNLFS